MRISPASGVRMPAMASSNDVLPLPDGPNSPSTSTEAASRTLSTNASCRSVMSIDSAITRGPPWSTRRFDTKIAPKASTAEISSRLHAASSRPVSTSV